MTQEQLDKLINFIDEAASYQAKRVTDDEADSRHYADAERQLRHAFAVDAAADGEKG